MADEQVKKLQENGQGCLANLEALGGCFFMSIIGIPIILIGGWFLWEIIKFLIFEMDWG
ncbi:hypothetical protein [Rummeliibacillus pycnus]|uniref:hypothetical protein n=1 Tax=Rummeliibacillus pycnus TaxID=101070 RepID=UPI0037C7DE0E